MLVKTTNFKKIIVLFIIGILGIILFLKYDIGIPCIFFELTGWYCPGCGITRAFVSLLQFDIYQAFRYNMLIVILLPFAIIYWIYSFALKGKKRIPNVVWYILLAITILFGVLRNISIFSYLAPTLIR